MQLFWQQHIKLHIISYITYKMEIFDVLRHIRNIVSGTCDNSPLLQSRPLNTMPIHIIGDIHGYYQPYENLLIEGNLIDGDLNWCGGDDQI